MPDYILISRHFPRIMLWAIAFGNVLFMMLHSAKVVKPYLVKSSAKGVPEPKYTWKHQDYPYMWPTKHYDQVVMTLHETVRFALNASDPLADEEWRRQTLMDDEGVGRLRLGPDHQVYVVMLYHQMHCLRVFQHAVTGWTGRDETHSDMDHVEHCLRILRQQTLCEAEVSLEKGDPFERDWELNRVGGTLICDDWQAIYADLKRNFQEWMEWSRVWN